MTASTNTQAISGFDKYFEITKRGSDTKSEVRGGLVTFFSMAYILALNPLILGTAADKDGLLISGEPKFTDAAQTIVDTAAVGHSIGMVAVVTALLAGVLTVLMGVIGRYPMGMAAGLGLNAMAAYVIAPTMTWPQTMGLIAWEGIIITLLMLTGFREAVFRAVPKSLRTAISVGIGLFITVVAFSNAGVIRKGATLPTLGVDGTLMGWPIVIFFVTLLLLIFLYQRKVKAAMLISIAVGTVLAIIVEYAASVGPRTDDEPTGWSLNMPAPPSLDSFTTPDFGLLGRVDLIGGFARDGQFTSVSILTGVMLVFSLLLADFFDTVGTVVAVGSEGGLLDENGEPPHLREILLVDSVSALFGGLGSASSNTSFVESTAGVSAGARTGLASVITGVAFLLCIFLTPVINMVPSAAVAPGLVLVGFMMLSQISEIDFTDIEMALPAFFTIVMMPFAYSITDGIGMGFIAFVLMKTFAGKARQLHPLMWVVSALFLIYFLQGLIATAIG